jgi:hypothetical protein
MFFIEPVVGFTSLYISLTFAAVYCFSTSIPLAFEKVYNFSPEAQGLVFISLIVGYVLAAPAMVIPYLWQQNDIEPQTIKPERLLFPAMMGSIALPVSFFWFAFSAKLTVHWIYPVISLGLFAWGNDLVYVSLQYAKKVFPVTESLLIDPPIRI